MANYFWGPVVVLLLFGSALVGVDRLAFRDVSHFYTPLYGYVAERTSEEWLPLWNPLDQTGIPLIGETSTAVLYPIRYALFTLPMNTSTAMAWYVALHLILCSFTAVWAARRAGVSSQSSAIAGVVYPLSGSVLFLYTNPPFLVGAAWLPLVLGSLIATKPLCVRTRCLIAGPALAMMVLGGDPQTAMHAVIIASAVLLCRLPKSPLEYPLRSAFCTLAVSVAVAAVLTLPQLVVSSSWSRQSDRVLAAEVGAWNVPPTAGTSRAEAYQFSLPPWHLAELITPNAFGSLFPSYRRLSTLIPGDGRIWTPSIYLGMLSAIALLARLGRWRRDGPDVWSAVAVLAILLSFGHFGVIWLVQQFGFLRDTDSAIGGAYWWVYQFLPGYSSFRYPTKWLPISSLAIAIITSQWVDQFAVQNRATRRTIWVIGAIVFAAFLVVILLRLNPGTIVDQANLPSDSYWGPLDVAGAMREIHWSLGHSILVLMAIVAIQYWLPERRAYVALILLITACDLGWQGLPLIAKTPIAIEQSLLPGASQDQPASDESRWMRTQTNGGWPTLWRETHDRDRIIDVAAAERASWFGRWHLEHRVNVLNNMSSISSNDMSLFWVAAERTSSTLGPAEQEEFWEAVRHWLTIDGAINTDSRVPQYDFVGETIGGDVPTVTLRKTNRDYHIAHYHDWKHQSISPTVESLVQLLSVIRQFGDDRSMLISDVSTSGPGLIDDHASRESIDVDVQQETLVCRTVFQDGNWFAEIVGEDGSVSAATVQKVDYLKQGVIVPAGKSTIRFRYAPAWMLLSLILAAAGWLIWLVFVVRANFGKSNSIA